MRVTMSERALTEQIRSLENIGAEVTAEEIQHRIDKHARRLFEHVARFGVQMLQDGFRVNGTLCTMSAQLKQSFSEEDCQTRISGLALLAPVSVSLDQQDLPAFVVNPVILAGMSDNWAAFGQSLQRVTLAELRPAIENAARQMLSAPVTPPSNEVEAEIQQLEYEQFLLAAGKGDQLRKEQKRREIEAHRQREEEAFRAQEQARQDAFWNNEG